MQPSEKLPGSVSNSAPDEDEEGSAAADEADALTSATAALDSERDTLPQGTRVSRYVLLDVLGRGAIGTVYRAHDPELERDIAIKVMRFSSEKRRERGLREAQALAQLSRHPNVITVYDVGTFDNDYVFIAMELVVGGTLRSWLEQATRTREQIVTVFLHAGQGLHAAHQAGMVHRDFKPDNVLVDEGGQVMVLDFGLARALDMSSDSLPLADNELESPDSGSLDRIHDATTKLHRIDSARDGEEASSPGPRSRPRAHGKHSSSQGLLAKTITRAGAIVGTPGYMPPEQLLGAATSTHADQFSYCVTLYEALYGDRPFAPRGSKFSAVRKAVLAGQVRPPPPNSRVPARLRQILVRGLSRVPTDRYPSMALLLDALAPFSKSHGRQLRGLAAAAIAIAVIAAAIVWIGIRAESSAAVCQGGETYWREAWAPSVRTAGRESFAKAGRSHAVDTWSRMASVIDKRQARWVATQQEICERTRVHASQSERLFDVRMSCMDARLRETKAFINTITTDPDATVVDNALQAAGELSSIEQCSTLESPAVPLPEDPVQRQAVLELEDQILRIDALQKIGRHTEALPVAAAAVHNAKTIDYPRIQALVGLYYGRLLVKPKNDLVAAEETLMKAANHAARAKDDALLGEIYTEIVLVLASSKTRFGEVARLSDLAENALTRAGNPPALRGQLCENRAILLATRGNAKEAYPEYECALDAYAEAFGPNSIKTASALTYMGFSLLLEGKYSIAWQRLEKAQVIVERNVGTHHPWRARGLTAMARIAYRLDRLDQAEELANEAHELYKQVYGEKSLSVASVRGTLAKIALARGQITRAREKADKSWQRATAILGANNRTSTLYQSVIAAVASAEGKYEEAIGHYQRLLETTRKSYSKGSSMITRPLLDLATTYRRSGDLAKAEEHLREAVAGIETGQNTDHPAYVEALNALAASRLAHGDAAGARQAIDKALTYKHQKRLSTGVRGQTQALMAKVLWRDPETRSEALAAGKQGLALLATSESVKFQNRRAELKRWLATRAQPE